jgi:threonine dehydratase
MLDIPQITYADVEDAASVLTGIAHYTDCRTSRTLNNLSRSNIFLKCENFQRGGAFKFRGAYHAVYRLDPDQKRRGVIAFSSGNHAQGVALACRMLDVPATIVMPRDSPQAKRDATASYGAQIVLYDRRLDDREAIAATYVDAHGMSLIPPYDHRDIIAGQGTAARELFEQAGPLDYLFVPIGGGGLISGCAIAAAELSPGCKIIGVEPEAGNDVQRSLQSGTIVRIDTPDTIADGAQTQQVGRLNFPILQRLVDRIVTVSDQQLCDAMRLLMERAKLVVEPTGCLALAAVLARAVAFEADARIGVLVSGGNIDASKFGECLLRGRSAEVAFG